MKTFIERTTLAAVMSASILGAACAPSNPMLTAPSEKLEALEQLAPVSAKVDYKPKVDVLFVIDNSDSMSEHQENLKKNIDRFVEAFNRAERLDFNIGVVSVFDSKRFGPVVREFYPLGQLRPLKDPARAGEAIAGNQFVTRAPRYNEVLGETLKIGTQARGTDRNDLGGPEFEESFTPVIAALDGRNVGFLRPDAHLAVIMITDANDDSVISPMQLDRHLWELKGRNREMISTYGVLALEGCSTDPGGAPTKILEFLRVSRGRAYNLCATDYGDKLAEAGRMIQQQASRVRIPLNAIPEATTLKVTFGGRTLEQDAVRGWTYDPASVSIVISGEADLGVASQPTDQIGVEFVPVDPRKMGSTRTTSIGSGVGLSGGSGR